LARVGSSPGLSVAWTTYSIGTSEHHSAATILERFVR
jgi:hypothetical protein